MKTWDDFEREAMKDPTFRIAWQLHDRSYVSREEALIGLAFALQQQRDEQMANNLHHLERCKGVAAL